MRKLSVFIMIMLFCLLNVSISLAQSFTYYTVRYGDTLGSIAYQYGTSWNAIAQMNGIYNPNHIFVGQVIKVPTSGTSTTATYVVKQGDTLKNIAARLGTTWQSLASLNGIYNPNLIYPGQTLIISGTVSPQPPVAGKGYVVRSGDTMYGISAMYGVNMWAIAQANNILNLNHIYVGQYLRIP